VRTFAGELAGVVGWRHLRPNYAFGKRRSSNPYPGRDRQSSQRYWQRHRRALRDKSVSQCPAVTPSDNLGPPTFSVRSNPRAMALQPPDLTVAP